MKNGPRLLQERLLSLVRSFPKRKIFVIGDVVADRFIHGVISRVSREAPVLILQHEQTETTPGGAANCALNLAALGSSVSLVSVVGNDEAGQTLLERLKTSGVDCGSLVVSDKLRTTTKVRVLAGQLHSTRQQVIRIDYEPEPLTHSDVIESLLRKIEESASSSEAIIISDYNYGVASDNVAGVIRTISERKNIPVFVDSRYHLSRFNGFTSATPNEDEVETLLKTVHSETSQLESGADQLRRDLGFSALLVTRGSQGMLLLEQDKAPLYIDAVGASEPVDVTGAGDTVIATYALALTSGGSFAEAAQLANHAGGLVVMKRGTASVSNKELEESVIQSRPST